MNKSESINELAISLAKAQGQMRGAVKDSANPFFKSKYADLQSVTEAIREAFSYNGLSYIQMLDSSKPNEIAVETIIMHSSGQWISNGVLSVPVSKHDAQGYGSAITYARRYSLSAATGVAPEEDDGNGAAKAKPKAPATPMPPEVKQAAAALTPVKAALVGVESNPENEAFLRDLADEITVQFDAGNVAGAFDTKQNAKLDSDDTLFLWNLFASNSKLRSALKKEGEDRRKAESAATENTEI